MIKNFPKLIKNNKTDPRTPRNPKQTGQKIKIKPHTLRHIIMKLLKAKIGRKKPLSWSGSVCMPSCFSHVQLFATLWTVAHQAPLSMEILQARILESVAMPSFGGSSWPRDWTHVSYGSHTAGRFLPAEPPGKPLFYNGNVHVGWFKNCTIASWLFLFCLCIPSLS